MFSLDFTLLNLVFIILLIIFPLNEELIDSVKVGLFSASEFISVSRHNSYYRKVMFALFELFVVPFHTE